MARNYLLLVLLVFTHICVGLVVCAVVVGQPEGSPAQIGLIALLRTQLSLLALYFALGTAYWLWRLLALVAGLAGWTAAFLFYQYADLPLAPTATLFTLLVVPVAVIGAIARSRGLLWGTVPEPAVGTLAAKQYSLGMIFRWTTLAALLLGLARGAEFPERYQYLWLSVVLINSLIVMTWLWTVVAWQSKLARLSLVVIVTLLVTPALQHFQANAWVIKFLLQAGLMFGTVEICGMAGWPLARKRGESEFTARAMSSKVPSH